MPTPAEKQHFLTSVVDYFIHPSLRTDSDMFYRVRILIAAMLTFPAVTLSAFLAVPL